jgi:hypothetical protein
MPLNTPEKLFQEAKEGKLLSAAERRHCLAWWAATQNEKLTNQEFGDIFHVTERTIRVDFGKIRNQIVLELVENKNVDFIVTDILLEFNKQIRDMEKAKRELEKNKGVGKEVYLKHCVAIVDMRLKVINSLQNLGWVPKSANTSTKDETVYIAEVGQDGSIETKKLKKITETTISEKSANRVINVSPESNGKYTAELTTTLPESDKIN